MIRWEKIPLNWYLEAGVSSPLAFLNADDWYKNLINKEIPALGYKEMIRFIQCGFDPQKWVLDRLRYLSCKRKPASPKEKEGE